MQFLLFGRGPNLQQEYTYWMMSSKSEKGLQSSDLIVILEHILRNFP